MAAESPKALGRGAYLYSDGTTQRIGWSVRDGQTTWVFVQGRAYRVDGQRDSGPALRQAQGDPEGNRRVGTRGSGSGARAPGVERAGSAAPLDDASLSAPMPATVTAVNVTIGQAVVKGDVLLTLEAMKMEMPVRAPRDGVVRRIGCGVGDLVKPGVPLVELSSS